MGWGLGFGCHDVAGHQPVRKKPKGKNGNPPQYIRGAQRCCATNIEFQIWQVIIYRDHERCKETYLRVACIMRFLPHLVFLGAFLCCSAGLEIFEIVAISFLPRRTLAELLANRNAQNAGGTAKSNQCLQTIYFRLPRRPCRPCHS